MLNDTRVLPARLLGCRSSGGGVELVLLRDLGEGRWECLSRPGRKTKPGTELSFGDGELTATVEAVAEGGNRIVRFHYEGIFLEVLERLGKMPLPPYIKEELQDAERYQTVYSRELGSAAAPTAGLHFTPELLEEIAKKGVKICYVTLHVGLGTFRPVKEEEIEDHPMHAEFCIVPEETARLSPRQKERRARDRRGHDLLPDAGELYGRGRHAPARLRLDEYLHLSRLSLQVHRRAGHQFPSAGEHADHAGLRPRGEREYPARL